MKLLSESELVWSPVVANTRMNRERNASGINSYEKEFRFSPEAYLSEHIAGYGHVKWLDLCCGQAKALIQAASHLSVQGIQGKAVLKGIDLIDSFLPVPADITCLTLETGSVVDWQPFEQYDLITCVHGIHYVGDKLKVISTILQSLSEEGHFYGNLDLNHIHVAGAAADFIKKRFKENDIQYNGKTRVLHCKGPRNIDFGIKYLGADDKAGPNYTGQEAVASFYSLQP